MSKIVKSVFGGGRAPAMPEPPKATPMVDEAAVLKAKRKAMTAARERGGRQSTILSDAGSETLG